MSKHNEFCPAAHGKICHIQAHRENPERPFVYQSPLMKDLWRVQVHSPSGEFQVKAIFDRPRALTIAGEFAKGDYRSAA